MDNAGGVKIGTFAPRADLRDPISSAPEDREAAGRDLDLGDLAFRNETDLQPRVGRSR